MAKSCIVLAEDQLERGGELAWEWPFRNDGWYFPEVREFFKRLEKMGLLYQARLDGCMVGVMASDVGKPMLKPWLICTTHKGIYKVLNLRCNGQHEHVPCEGGCRTRDSAFYPKKMCRLVSREVMTFENYHQHLPQDNVFGVEETVKTETTEKDQDDGKPHLTKEELSSLKLTIKRLHDRSGHPSNSALVNCLRARGVPKHVLELAKEHKCDACQEVRLPKPKGHVSLEKCETIWHTLQMDVGQFRYRDQVVHVLFMVDEASHYMVSHEMFRHDHQESRNSTTEEVIRALEVAWVQHYGFPNIIKCDLEGAFRGYNFSLWGQERGVEFQNCPAEAHETIGDVESLIGKIKVDTRTYLRDKDIDPYSGILHMITAHNTMDRIGGYAPCQWALGRLPSFDDRLFEGGHAVPLLASQGTAKTELAEQLRLRVHAEEIYRRSQATQRINRAMNSRTNKLQYFVPGDMVYYRRYKTPAQNPSNKDLDHPKVGLARWYGPARILATETKADLESGVRKPSMVVWVVAGGRLKRCAAQQLRHASMMEKLAAEASGGATTMPWSFTTVLSSLEAGQFDSFDDLAFDEDHPMQRPERSSFQPRTPGRSRSRARSEAPDASRRSSVRDVTKGQTRPQQDPLKDKTAEKSRSEAAVTGGAALRKRSPSREETRKREAPTEASEFDVPKYLRDPNYDPLANTPSVVRGDRPESSAPGAMGSGSHGKHRKTRSTSPENMLQDALATMESDEDEDGLCAAVAYYFDAPEEGREKKKFMKDPAVWIVQKMKKGAEVKLSNLSAKEVEEFKVAKMTEVNSWIQEQACRGARQFVPKNRCMRMRWILTVKDTGKKKARIVLLGFEDPDITTLTRASPTMTRRTRQLMLTYCTIQRWKMLKGDIRSAFLQGMASEEQREIFAYPLPELADALGISRDHPVQILKAAYGLVNAPAAWHTSVCEAMSAAGFEPLITEPCAWRLREWNEETQKMDVVGLVAAHVDDFLFCGDDESPKWQRAVSAVYHRFQWSPWELDEFAHCGVKIRQNLQGDFTLDHAEFCVGLEQIQVASDRRDDEAATPEEQAQLRGLLGGAQWRCYQTAPQHAARLSMLQSEVSKPTVQTLRQANKLCREIYQNKHVSIRVGQLQVKHPSEVIFINWCDAALGNRPGGGSTGGYLLAASSPVMLDGTRTNANPISWKSGKLSRVARSSLSAEIQSFSEAEEELMYTRLQWAEMLGEEVPMKNPEACVKKVPGVMVTDARSLYDIVMRGDKNTSGLGLKDKYSALEALSVIQRLQLCSTTTRWVHSEAQLADALTKHVPSSALLRMLVDGAWNLVEDPSFKSSKRRRKEGINFFE